MSSETLHISVVIPTHNGENTLPRVLEKLKMQKGTGDISWEIIVVDNNSTDNTENIVREYQKAWLTEYPLKYVFEPKQGVLYARNRGAQEAKGEFVGFLDDDNIPADDWVKKAYEFGKDNPKAGAWASRAYGEFEGEIPQGFEKIKDFFAAIDRGKELKTYRKQDLVLPPGAGLVVRRYVWLKITPKLLNSSFFFAKRYRNRWIPGEDIIALVHMQNEGFEIWYNPDMVISHIMPAWRMKKDYILSFFRGIGLSRYPTRNARLKVWQKPFWLLLYMANDLYRFTIAIIKNLQDKNNLSVICERELRLGSLISPFYYLKAYLQNVLKKKDK